MAKQTQKRISEGKQVHLERKKHTWTVRTLPGGYKKDDSIALGIVLRDLIKIAKNMREVKIMLNSAKIKVDGIIRKNYRLPIGLFSVIETEDKSYRLIVDAKGRFKTQEEKKTDVKIIKLTSKKKVKDGKLNLRFNDGTNIVLEKTGLKVGDSVLYDFRNSKIKEEIPFAKGSLVYIYNGINSNKIGKITKITESTQKKKSLITIKLKDKETQTVKEKLIAIGKEKALLEIGEKK